MAYTRRRAFIAAATFLVRARCRCHVSCTAGVMLHGACVAVPCVARLVCGLGLRRCSRRADASPLACAGAAVYGTLLSLSRIRGVWCPTAVDGVRSHVRAGLGGASACKRKLPRDRRWGVLANRAALPMPTNRRAQPCIAHSRQHATQHRAARRMPDAQAARKTPRQLRQSCGRTGLRRRRQHWHLRKGV